MTRTYKELALLPPHTKSRAYLDRALSRLRRLRPSNRTSYLIEASFAHEGAFARSVALVESSTADGLNRLHFRSRYVSNGVRTMVDCTSIELFRVRWTLPDGRDAPYELQYRINPDASYTLVRCTKANGSEIGEAGCAVAIFKTNNFKFKYQSVE